MYHFYNKFHRRETLPCDIQNCHPANWPIRLLEINMRYNKGKCHRIVHSALLTTQTIFETVPERINSYLNIDGMRDRWVNIIPSALKTSKQPRWGLVNKTLITRCRNRSIERAAYLILLIQSGSRGEKQQMKLSTTLMFSISSWKLWLKKRWGCEK